MNDESAKVMGWPAIVGIMVATGLIAGLVLGAVRSALGMTGGSATAGVGAAVGITGALLIGRRRAALAERARG